MTSPFSLRRLVFKKHPSETLINSGLYGNGHKNYFVRAATTVSKPENEFSTLENDFSRDGIFMGYFGNEKY
ncbi:MAG: hypothetical protein IKR18_07260 [Bacteroidaceae bacterium]|nr:hypothetical protein [Bacteroidaceae bacterium]